MLDFQLAAFLSGIIPLAAAWLAYVTTRDTLHPMIYLGAMACFLHAFLPLYLEITQPDELRGYLRQAELDYAQTIALLGILSLCGGVWWGAHGAITNSHAPSVPLTSAGRDRLVRVGVALATLGLTEPARRGRHVAPRNSSDSNICASIDGCLRYGGRPGCRCGSSTVRSRPRTPSVMGRPSTSCRRYVAC